MESNSHNIHIHENFLSKESCDMLLKYSIDNPELYGQTSQDFWSGRILSLFDNRVDQYIQTIGTEYLRKAKKYITNAAGKEVWPDILNYAKWWDGYIQRPHADGENENGDPHPFPWRKFGCVYYLNDDYEGGEIWFPNFDISLKPESNTMVFFPGDALHLHGVKNVDSGIRHTIASFWAYEKQSIDI